MDVLRVVLKPILRRVALRLWVGRTLAGKQGSLTLSRDGVNRILAAAWRIDAELVHDLPRGGSLGNRHILRLAGMTLAFLRALEAHGLQRGAAVDLVSEAVWAVFRPLTDLTWVTARLRTAKRLEQVRIMMLLSLRYPFCPPGFVFEVTPDRDAVVVDFHRCPVAEYLGGQQASDLCVGAWCQQDYRLASRWGVILQRTGTRASGAERCDFRFVEPG